jgi:hypothetical protein
VEAAESALAALAGFYDHARSDLRPPAPGGPARSRWKIRAASVRGVLGELGIGEGDLTTDTYTSAVMRARA